MPNGRADQQTITRKHKEEHKEGGIKKNYRVNVASSLKSYIIIIIIIIVQWRK